MHAPTPALTFDFAGIELNRRYGLSRQLYQTLRERILDGRVSGGTRLPASRDLALSLGISRNSVVRAYDQLYAEGFPESRVQLAPRVEREEIEGRNPGSKCPRQAAFRWP